VSEWTGADSQVVQRLEERLAAVTHGQLTVVQRWEERSAVLNTYPTQLNPICS
jgi:hypothetical protein